RRLKELIEQEGVDLVHARSRAPAWSARSAARRARVPFVTTFHGAYGARSAAKRAWNRIMVRGDLVIAVSEFIAAHMKETYRVPPERIRVVHRGIDAAAFDPRAVPPRERAALRAAWAVPEDAQVVLLPGRHTRLKGHAVLIEAMRLLADPNLVAVFAGSDRDRDAYRQELEAQARGLPVRFAGHIDDVAAAYAASDVVVSASVQPESFGRVLAEAGAMGVPVVASDHGGAREILLHGETGWLVPPGDPAALAEGIRTALAGAGPALAERARGHVLARFTRAAMCAKTLAVYGELL
ncbi:MAG: glycosyltransferase family 4 protein, partial [Acidobacteria bacterium]|nr:glycosyltransferase family 4 protein [Acidobacteriota bacterium]